VIATGHAVVISTLSKWTSCASGASVPVYSENVSGPVAAVVVRPAVQPLPVQ